jgi:hypothetical protein
MQEGEAARRADCDAKPEVPRYRFEGSALCSVATIVR